MTSLNVSGVPVVKAADAQPAVAVQQVAAADNNMGAVSTAVTVVAKAAPGMIDTFLGWFGAGAAEAPKVAEEPQVAGLVQGPLSEKATLKLAQAEGKLAKCIAQLNTKADKVKATQVREVQAVEKEFSKLIAKVEAEKAECVKTKEKLVAKRSPAPATGPHGQVAQVAQKQLSQKKLAKIVKQEKELKIKATKLLAKEAKAKVDKEKDILKINNTYSKELAKITAEFQPVLTKLEQKIAKLKSIPAAETPAVAK